MSVLTYEGALGLFYPATVWKSQGRNIYSEIQWISGPALPSEEQLSADIATYDFTGGVISQFITGSIPQMSGTAVIPFDNTVPLITEGFQVWSRTLSLSNPGSVVMINGTLSVDNAANGRHVTLAVFANNTCIGTSSTYITTAGRPFALSFNLSHTQPTAGNVTFSMRAGANGAGTTHINQANATTLGGSMASNYTIMELQR